MLRTWSGSRIDTRLHSRWVYLKWARGWIAHGCSRARAWAIGEK